MVALAAGLEQIAEPLTRRWLAKGRLDTSVCRREWLPRVLETLGVQVMEPGLGALRYWEQTGAPPEGWIAAADPVWLEAGMNHLHLHALPAAALPAEDVQAAFERLRSELGADAFVSVGASGYLVSADSIATASVSPALAEGGAPERYLPSRGMAQGGREHDRLLAEVQMCLFDSGFNLRRMAAGAPPLNALWLWGGGTAPPKAERELPALFADDPVLRGFWRSSSRRLHGWPGTIGACLAVQRGDFVAMPPPGDTEPLLTELREAMAGGAIGRLVVLFADGASVDLRRGDRFRFWRRAAWPGTGP